MSIIPEQKDELSNSIDNLRDCFNEFDFLTKDGLTVESLSDISGFESLALDDSELISFDDFCDKIKKSLYSLQGDLKKSDFDWDNLSDNYHDVYEKYQNFISLKEQVENNLTGNQEFDSVEIYDKENLNDLIFDYLISNNLIYEIENQGEIHFLLNEEFEKKLKN